MKHSLIIDENPGRANISNAYNRLLCDAIEAEGAVVREFSIKRLLTLQKPSILHFHFPEFIAGFESLSRMKKESGKLFLSLRLAKAMGSKVVWTAHNAGPHECPHPEAAKRFMSKWTGFVDGVIFLSEASKSEVIAKYAELSILPNAVIPHGHYKDVLKGGIEQKLARKDAGLPEQGLVIASIGAVRRYKNLPLLVKAFLAVAQSTDCLLVAGAYGEDALRQDIEAAAAGDARVHLRFGLLSELEMESLHSAADLLVSPYSQILNSGSAFYALSCSRPFLGPRLGSLPEIQAVVGDEWVRLYEGAFGAEVLREAMESLRTNPLRGAPDLDPFDWKLIGEATVEFFRNVIACDNRPGK